MKDINLFFSWQSDLENRTNRNLIESCLKNAINEISKKTVRFNFILDSATRNEVGSVDIPNAIFNKIRKSDIFIADVSIINQNDINRKTSNPNVLIELGYAAGILSWKNIICVTNLEYGKIEELPFDIRHRKVVPYKFGKNDVNNEIKKNLTSRLASEIKEYINFIEPEDYTDKELKRLMFELVKKIKNILPFELVDKISNLNFDEDFAESIVFARKLRPFIDTVENPDIKLVHGVLFDKYIELIDTALFLSGNKKLNDIFSKKDKSIAKLQLSQLIDEYKNKAKEFKILYIDFIDFGNNLFVK